MCMDNNVITVIVEKEDRNKLIAMQECDYAFQKSIVNSLDFDAMWEKISKNAIFLVAQNEKLETVGYAALYANNTKTHQAYISLLCVKKEAQNNHVGQSLINECIEKALCNKMNSIKLEVLTNNYKAIAFYRHNGFEIYDINQEKNSYYMLKNL